jgi:hypothetical protein
VIVLLAAIVGALVFSMVRRAQPQPVRVVTDPPPKPTSQPAVDVPGLSVGMSRDEVRAVLGAPPETHRDQLSSRLEWRYRGATVYFDDSNLVERTQRY